MFTEQKNGFPRRDQTMPNKIFMQEFFTLAAMFIAGYAFMVVA
jgi:hypothetical protein